MYYILFEVQVLHVSLSLPMSFSYLTEIEDCGCESGLRRPNIELYYILFKVQISVQDRACGVCSSNQPNEVNILTHRS